MKKFILSLVLFCGLIFNASANPSNVIQKISHSIVSGAKLKESNREKAASEISQEFVKNGLQGKPFEAVKAFALKDAKSGQSRISSILVKYGFQPRADFGFTEFLEGVLVEYLESENKG